jgi:hypothetical protein
MRRLYIGVEDGRARVQEGDGAPDVDHREPVALIRAECSTSGYESDARACDGLEWHPR